MKTQTTDHGSLDAWTPQDVDKALQQGKITLIDVRTPQEFTVERIEGALLFPMQGFNPKNLPCQHSKPIVLLCGSGARSGQMADLVLSTIGGPIAHLDGGMTAWKESGMEYVDIDKSTGAPRKTRNT